MAQRGDAPGLAAWRIAFETAKSDAGGPGIATFNRGRVPGISDARDAAFII